MTKDSFKTTFTTGCGSPVLSGAGMEVFTEAGMVGATTVLLAMIPGASLRFLDGLQYAISEILREIGRAHAL